MIIILNGEKLETKSETILQLLKELNVIPERVAVEVNTEIIKRVRFENYRLHDGDSVEIVYFVGGGAIKLIAHRKNYCY